MNLYWHYVAPVVSELQALSPMQLLAAAVCTVLLGYLGILWRTAIRT